MSNQRTLTGDVSPSERERVRSIMATRRGAENAITSRELAQRIGIDDAEAQPKTRARIRDVIAVDGLPIAATSEGYFVIETQAEFLTYLQSLTHRVAEIEERKRLVIEAMAARDDDQQRLDVAGERDADGGEA